MEAIFNRSLPFKTALKTFRLGCRGVPDLEPFGQRPTSQSSCLTKRDHSIPDLNVLPWQHWLPRLPFESFLKYFFKFFEREMEQTSYMDSEQDKYMRWHFTWQISCCLQVIISQKGLIAFFFNMLRGSFGVFVVCFLFLKFDGLISFSLIVGWLI